MNRRVSGFTLFETLISVGLLSIMLFGSVTLILQMVIATDHNKNVVTASYMLQECMELTRNFRDSRWKQNLQWDCGLVADKKFRIDGSDISEKLPLTTDDACYGTSFKGDYVYLYEVENETDEGQFQIFWDEIEPYFYRKIHFTHEDETQDKQDQVLAHCEVWWYERGERENLEMSMGLTNWHKR